MNSLEFKLANRAVAFLALVAGPRPDQYQCYPERVQDMGKMPNMEFDDVDD